jgi:hypothetical protein
VSRSTFSGNSTTGDGGAVDSGDHGGSATATALGTATSTYTATTTNTATDTATLSGSTFDDNTAGSSGDGGAIDSGDHGGSATAFGTEDIGGTIYTGKATDTETNMMTVSASTFAGNSAGDGAAIDNGDHGGSTTATNEGAFAVIATAIAKDTDTLTVSASTIAGNSASGDGGAIDNGDHDGTETATGPGPATVESEAIDTETQSAWDSTFSRNSASGDGGATDNGDHGGSATAVDTQTTWDSTFSGNTGGRGAVTDNGDNSGSGTVNEAADIIDGSCLQGTGAGSLWVDAGYNAVSDASCQHGGTDDSTTLTSKELGPLASNGGPTQTEWPLAGNPALGLVPASTSLNDNGTSVELCPATDQRGVTSAPGSCNAGAVQNGAPVITSPSSDSVAVGTSFSLKVTSVSHPAAAFTESGTLPSGVGFSGGVLSGTDGTYYLTITAKNAYGAYDQYFILTVYQVPSITSASYDSVAVGTSFSFTVTTTGYPVPAITETAALPSGVVLSGGVLSGTPAPGTHGTYHFTITATNPHGVFHQYFTLTVE